MTTEVKSIFDVVNNICSSRELLPMETVVGLASPYMLNRSMSFNHDTIFYADEASMFRNVETYPLYLYYFYTTPKKKRFGKWAKKVNDEDVKLIQDLYEVSEKKAIQYLEVLRTEQVEELRKLNSKGGKAGRASKKK